MGYEALKFTYKYLQHDGGPWKYTPEQARLLLWWYALDDNGKFAYRTGVIQRMKGHGKEPLGATIAAFELCGNCRFSEWDDNGDPVGRKPAEPWVQIVGVSRDSTRAMMKLFPALFNKRAIAEFGLEICKEVIYANGATGRIEAVTSSARALEGGRPSLVIATETHHFVRSNEGIEVIRTARRNAAKVGGRMLALTNAYQPSGSPSVAQLDREGYEKILAGQAIDPGIMYDSLEAPSDAPLTPEALAKVITKVRGDSHWVPVEDIVREILDPTSSPAESRRFYYNQVVAADEALVSPAEWDPLADRTLELRQNDEIVLGLDGGRSDDSTALVAIRIDDRAVFPIRIWNRPEELGREDKWEVDMGAVDDFVAHVMDRHQVRAFFSDVHPIESYVDKWSNDYRDDLLIKASPGKSAVGYDMRGHLREITLYNEALVGSIRGGGIRHDGNEILRQHVLNARQRQNSWGMSFGKEGRESAKKVDGYAALLLAYIALTKYLESGKRPKASTAKRGWLF